MKWDAKPKYMIHNGQTAEFFYRGDLANALNRKVVTLRKWEREGILCHPQLKSARGWWLYTRDQIEDLVQLAAEEGVLKPSPGGKFKGFTPRFISEANRILKRLP